MSSRDDLEERIVLLENLLEQVLENAPRCFFSNKCKKAAVYSMPTAVIGDRIHVCEDHKTRDENEFEEKTTELKYVALHRKIEKALELK